MGMATTDTTSAQAKLVWGQTLVASSTVAVQLPGNDCHKVWLQADPGNTPDILVGDANGQHLVLQKGVVTGPFYCPRLDQIFVLLSTGTTSSKVNWAIQV